MPSPKLIALSGSARRGSLNRAVLATAAIAASSAGAEITLVDLNDYELPLFNQDLEDAEGMPDAAKRLKALFRAADGFILASPEHNSSYSALLKNTIDWCSRAESDDEPPLVAFVGKSALLLAGSARRTPRSFRPPRTPPESARHRPSPDPRGELRPRDRHRRCRYRCEVDQKDR